MVLKAVEVFGYKSFADKIRLEFGAGITGILGPNGSGKSNVIECVRWCLGETSWRSLRAGAMVDVIFAGTRSRSPLSMAEVNLIFDNAGGLLPVDYSEVVVGRRIFRSGESSYFLNKTQCRLRDIRELFLDTGLGEEGYAIIDQGGVDFVLSAKPEDRRALFEEASGVSKYKAKREEALRKLDRVEADMSRLGDALALIEDQVKKLERDARKAAQYESFRRELSELEKLNLCKEASAIEESLSDLSSRAAPLEEECARKTEQKDACEAEFAAMDLRLAALRKEIMDLKAKRAEASAELAGLSARAAAAQDAAENSSQRRQAAETELSRIEARMSEMEPEIARAGAARAAAQEDFSKAEGERSAKSAEVFALREAGGEIEESLRKAKAEFLRRSQAALDSRRALDQARSQATDLEAGVRSVSRELSREEERRAAARAEAASSRERKDRAAAELEAASGAFLAAEAAWSGERDALRSLLALISDISAERALLQGKKEALEAQAGKNPYWAGARACLDAGIPGVLGMAKDIFAACDVPRRTIEDLLGERSCALLVQDASAAREGIEFLKARGSGRARFLVLDAIPESAPRTPLPSEAKDLSSMLSIKGNPAFEKAARFLVGEAFALGGSTHCGAWVCGGGEPGPLDGGLSALDEAEKGLRLAGERLESLGLKKSEAEISLSAREASMKAASSAKDSSQSRSAEASITLREKEESLSRIEEGIVVLSEEALKLKDDLELERTRVAELEAQCLAGAEAENAARRSEDEFLGNLALSKEAQHASEVALAALEGQCARLRERAAYLEREAEGLVREKKALEETAAERRAEIRELESRRNERLQEARDCEAAGAAVRESMAGLESGLAELDKSLSGLEETAAAKTAEISEIANALNSAKDELFKCELEISSRRASLDSIRARFDEKMADDLFPEQKAPELSGEGLLPLESAEGTAPRDPVEASREGRPAPEARPSASELWEAARARFKNEPPPAPGRLEALRKRLASIGSVNLAAGAEHAELSARQAFLISQREDLSRAKEDLLKAIGTANASTKDSFQKTYEQVRENFQKIYGALFQGGEADLVLTQPDNPLETGVDIVAQPPGKRLQSLGLLSGGEKALTALALLFAFFMVKPAPFCMLDEADGALDDANVGRLVRMLREFSSRTQFIVVSHNKRMLEASDVVYGVTMEEMGVSQIVSMSLEKAARKAELETSAA